MIKIASEKFKTDLLPVKQEKFCQEYAQDFSLSRAAIAAGYSKSMGWQLIQRPEIQRRIGEILKAAKETAPEAIADATEVLIALTDIGRGGERDADRIKALEVLSKFAELFAQVPDEVIEVRVIET